MTPIDVTQVPLANGIWLRDAAAPLLSKRAPALPGVSDDQLFTLVVGGPGEATPSTRQLAETVRRLAPAVRERLVLSVYGPEPDAHISLAQRLCDALGVPVRARHGVILPHGESDQKGSARDDGSACATAVDAKGRPAWRPFAQLSLYRPGEIGAVVEQSWMPFPTAAAVGPARCRLTDAWMVDVVPAGLLVQSVNAISTGRLSCAPTHPDRVDLIVAAVPGELLPDDMLTALGRLADVLPFEARTRLRVVLLPGVEPLCAQALRWAVPAPQDMLEADDDASAVPLPEPFAVEPFAVEPLPLPEPPAVEPFAAEPFAAEPPAAEPPAVELPNADRLTLVETPLEPVVVRPQGRLATVLVLSRQGHMMLI